LVDGVEIATFDGIMNDSFPPARSRQKSGRANSREYYKSLEQCARHRLVGHADEDDAGATGSMTFRSEGQLLFHAIAENSW
jgi:hypothetical protein